MHLTNKQEKSNRRGFVVGASLKTLGDVEERMADMEQKIAMLEKKVSAQSCDNATLHAGVVALSHMLDFMSARIFLSQDELCHLGLAVLGHEQFRSSVRLEDSKNAFVRRLNGSDKERALAQQAMIIGAPEATATEVMDEITMRAANEEMAADREVAADRKEDCGDVH